MAFLIYTLGLLLSLNLVVGNFSYDGTHGPSYWGNDYKTCLGKYQSPIDIQEKDVTSITFPELQFSGLQDTHTAYITNNGHTVMIKTNEPEVPTVSGGPLDGIYEFQQLHFHWGQTDELGSEDLINNHSFSMELHAVFWKKEYGSPDEAMKHSDGLAVLAYLFQATDKPNTIFRPIVSIIPEIVVAGSNVTINDEKLLRQLVAPDFSSAQNYFTYKGSLTTPPCLEIVQWIDFEEPRHISHEQLAEFRNIKSAEGTSLTHNFRPVQPLDGRIVYRNSGTSKTASSTSGEVDAPATPATAVPSSAGTISTSAAPKQTTPATPAAATESGKEAESEATTEIPSNMEPMNEKSGAGYGQASLWNISPIALLLRGIFLLP